MFGSNPHIKRFPDRSIEEQVKYLQSIKLITGQAIAITNDGNIELNHPIRTFEGGEICAYPTEKIILGATDTIKFSDRPFTKMVLLGSPQVYPTVFFEMKVLERYYNDPRYIVESADYRGQINLTFSCSNDPDTLERDKVVIEFGLGYDGKSDRVITVPLRRLYRLPPEQQQYWKTFMISGECKLSENYYRNIILGEFAEGVSIYKAFIKEQEIINDISKLMNKPNLFRETYGDGRPKNFHIILLPTRRNYLNFIHTLDKMLSENLNKEFFKNGINLEQEIMRKDGRIKVRQRNTVALLDEWLRKSFEIKDGAIFNEIIESLKKVRKIRQKPAHLISDDEFDKKYWEEQKDIMDIIYTSLRYIRLLFRSSSSSKRLQGSKLAV